jgi:hypothetical protein
MPYFYDPTAQKWYDDASKVPPNTTVFDQSSGKYVTVSPGPGSPGPGLTYEQTGGHLPIADPNAGMSFTLNPASAPANAPSPSQASQLVDPNQGSAHEIAAQLLQSEFQSWEQTFKPIELAEMQELSFNNPNVLPTALNKATAAATGASEAAGGILSRANLSQGIKPNAQQTQATNRILDLSRAQNIATAKNQARSNVAQQDVQILMGQAPNPNLVRQAITQGA